AALLGIDEIADRDDFESALGDPVESGKAGIERTMFDIARHLLRTNEHAFDLGVVGGWEVGATVGVDFEARGGEERDGGVLQAALGNAESELHCDTSAESPMGRVKQERVPS